MDEQTYIQQRNKLISEGRFIETEEIDDLYQQELNQQ